MQKVNFLDYEIVNSGNSDGWVLTKPGAKLYECHLGNFQFIDEAQKTAVIHYMIARPEQFATQIARRAMGLNGTYHEWFKLDRQIKAEGLEMPEEITQGSGMNFLIYYKDEPIKY